MSKELKQNLDDLRIHLKDIYQEWFLLMSKRKKIVEQIKLVKEKLEIPLYDSEREHALSEFFKNDIEALTVKERLSLSLMMEAHIASSDYPNWSEKISNLNEAINPILKENS